MANRYFIGTGARNWNDSANWSETSGGAGGASVPTSADAVILDANSGTGTIILDADFNCLSFDASALGAVLTIAGSVFVFNCYGSFTGNTNLTFNLTGTSYFYSRGTGTITQGGATLTWNRWYIDGSGITVTNWDNFNIGSAVIYHTNGTWNINGKTISCSQLTNGAGTKTLTYGSGTINTAIYYLFPTGLTLNKDTGTINISGPYPQSFAGKDHYNVNITSAGTTTITDSSVTFNNLTRTGGGVVTDLLGFRGSITVTGTLTLTGNNATNYRLLVASNTIGTARTITCNGSIVAENVDFRDIVVAGTAAPFDASAIPGGSGDCGGNSGITFTPAQKQYFKHTSGAVSWSDSTKWFSNEAKTTAGRVPLPQDDVQFDAGSFTGASTLTVNCPRIGKSLDMSAVSQAVRITLVNDIECYGSYVLGNNITSGWEHYVTRLYGRGECIYKSYGKFQYLVNIYTGNYTNQSTINQRSIQLFGQCSFDFNDFDAYFTYFQVVENQATAYLGNGTLTFNMNSSGAVFHVVAGTVIAENSTIVVKPTHNADYYLSFYNVTLNKFVITGVLLPFVRFISVNISELVIEEGHTVKVLDSSTLTLGKLTAIGTPSAPITITSATTTPFNLVKTGAGLVNVSNCNISYCNATPNRFFAMDSVDGGNNTGWNFGQIGASPGEIGLSVIEDAEAEVIGEAILSPNFSETEELGCQVFADALVPGFELSEAESMDADAFGEAVITPDFVESEIMDADLKATALASADFVEHEQAGDDHGVLRMFENILNADTLDGRLLGETSFTTEINSESKIL